jgi:hypothetical protein
MAITKQINSMYIFCHIHFCAVWGAHHRHFPPPLSCDKKMDFRRDAQLVMQVNCAKSFKALFETLATTAIEGVFEFSADSVQFQARQREHKMRMEIETKYVEIYRYAFDVPFYRIGMEFNSIHRALLNVTDNTVIGFVVTARDVANNSFAMYVSDSTRGTIDNISFTNKSFTQTPYEPETYVYDQVLQLPSTGFKQIVTSCKDSKVIQFMSKQISRDKAILFYITKINTDTSRHSILLCANVIDDATPVVAAAPPRTPQSIDDIVHPLETLGCPPEVADEVRRECDKRECFPLTALQDITRANGVAKQLRMCLGKGQPLAVVYNINSIGRLSFIVPPAPDASVLRLEKLLTDMYSDMPMLMKGRWLSGHSGNAGHFGHAARSTQLDTLSNPSLANKPEADSPFGFLDSFGTLSSVPVVDFTLSRKTRAQIIAAERGVQGTATGSVTLSAAAGVGTNSAKKSKHAKLAKAAKPKESKEPKEPKEPKELKEPKEPKPPKTPKPPKSPKQSVGRRAKRKDKTAVLVDSNDRVESPPLSNPVTPVVVPVAIGADDDRPLAELAALTEESRDPPRDGRPRCRIRRVAGGRRNHEIVHARVIHPSRILPCVPIQAIQIPTVPALSVPGSAATPCKCSRSGCASVPKKKKCAAWDFKPAFEIKNYFKICSDPPQSIVSRP